MGAQLPKELGGPGGGPGAEDRGPEAAAGRQRNAVAVMPGMQAPHDPQAFSGVKTREAPRKCAPRARSVCSLSCPATPREERLCHTRLCIYRTLHARGAIHLGLSPSTP